MKTFEELKQEITPEIIKKMCEMAEGFECTEYENPYNIILFDDSTWYVSDYTWPYFTILIYRAVEGWNNRETDYNQIGIKNRRIVYWSKKYDYINYQ